MPVGSVKELQWDKFPEDSQSFAQLISFLRPEERQYLIY
jgi:hypothetical protein